MCCACVARGASAIGSSFSDLDVLGSLVGQTVPAPVIAIAPVGSTGGGGGSAVECPEQRIVA